MIRRAQFALVGYRLLETWVTLEVFAGLGVARAVALLVASAIVGIVLCGRMGYRCLRAF